MHIYFKYHIIYNDDFRCLLIFGNYLLFKIPFISSDMETFCIFELLWTFFSELYGELLTVKSVNHRKVLPNTLHFLTVSVYHTWNSLWLIAYRHSFIFLLLPQRTSCYEILFKWDNCTLFCAVRYWYSAIQGTWTLWSRNCIGRVRGSRKVNPKDHVTQCPDIYICTQYLFNEHEIKSHILVSNRWFFNQFSTHFKAV